MLKLHSAPDHLEALTSQHMLTLAIVMRDKLDAFIGKQATTEPTEPFEELASRSLNEAFGSRAMADIMSHLLSRLGDDSFDSDDIGDAVDSWVGAELF